MGGCIAFLLRPLHGLGLFSIDGIKVGYGTVTELMEYVGPLYRYNNWLILVQYTRSMRRYRVIANYIQQEEHNKNKGATMYMYKLMCWKCSGYLNTLLYVLHNMYLITHVCIK